MPPKENNNTKKSKINWAKYNMPASVRLPPKIQHKLAILAKKTMTNKSQIIRDAVDSYLKKKKNQELLNAEKANGNNS